LNKHFTFYKTVEFKGTYKINKQNPSFQKIYSDLLRKLDEEYIIMENNAI